MNMIIRSRRCWLALLVASSLVGCNETVDAPESAFDKIRQMVDEDIKPDYRENTVRANISLTETNLLTMLPSLDDYPMQVNERDTPQQESVEIFTSSEKSGQGRDGLFIKLATDFNREQQKLADGRNAAIAIRSMPSGLGASFILSGQYVPDAYSPSSLLWGQMIDASGVDLTMLAEVTAPNTAGIVYKQDKADRILIDGKLDVSRLLTSVTSGDFAMGYTDPFQSSTGLNFLLTVLDEFSGGDETQLLSPDVASAFEAFQAGVPFVAQNTLQMRDAAQGSGVLDAMVMEHQTWTNVSNMSDYSFVPFGVRHDSPLYATQEADEAEREVLAMFVEFIQARSEQVGQYGFGELADYRSSWELENGSLITRAQRLWKERKSGGRPIAAVFVADVSGSMEGTRLRKLQEALLQSADLISAENAIGLITYADRVNVDLPVRKFDVQQKSLFSGAVERLIAGGRTATNDAVMVGARLLGDFAVDHPDHKLVLFVLSDGETNRGLGLDVVEPILEFTGIPIHSIAYELQSEELKKLSSLAEGAYIESNVDSASYRIGTLLNAEM